MTSQATTPAPATASRRVVISRAAALGATATVAGATAIGATGPAAAAGAAYRPRRWRGRRMLGRRGRHLASRFSYGVTPALASDVRRAGGALAWFEAQLDPASVADPAGDQVDAWWPSFQRGARDLWARQIAGTEGGWEVMNDLQRCQMVRRIVSTRQVHEVMTEFWQNHLNVSMSHDAAFTFRADYDRAIREHALGSFRDLLHTSTTHPAMGIYLSNAVSTKDHPNENLGRELLELHTVGRGSYGEEDVKSSARILTGWRVDMWRTWDAWYSLADHWTGPVRVMGFSDPNAPRTGSDGEAVARRYTDYLARHPRTAQRLARKLAVKFVSDTPSSELVDRLARIYLDNDTEIKPVLRALVRSPEFLAAQGAKIKDPVEDVVASYRALQVRLSRPTTDQAAVNAMLWQAGNLGVTPFGWPTPDGQPADNSSWSSPSRMLASMDLHFALSGGWWPKEGIGYRAPTDWLPRRRLRFDLFVDHLCQQVLHTRSTPVLLQACCEAVGVQPGTVMSADHAVLRWSFARLMSTLLDSPTHLSR